MPGEEGDPAAPPTPSIEELLKEQRRLEAALAEAEGRYAALMAHSSDVLMVLDDHLRVLYISPSVTRLSGHGPDVAMHPDRSMVHPDDRAGAVAFLRSALHDEDPAESHEFRARHADGSWRYVEAIASDMRAVPGVNGLAVTVRDIGPRRSAQETAHHLAAIVESSDDAIVGFALDGAITTWNRGAVRTYGYPATEILGRHASVLVPDELRAEIDDLLARVQRGERIELFDTVRVRRDGSRIDVAAVFSAVTDTSGTIVGASAIERDITERRRAVLELRMLVEGVRDHAVFLLDPDGRIVSWNVGAARLLDYGTPEILGRPWSELLAGGPDALANPDRLLARAIIVGQARDEVRLARGDGTAMAADVFIASLTHEGGARRGFSIVVRDITERRHLEEQLVQSQKMEAIGRLAGGIAHDFNNLLTAILGYTEMALEGVPDDDPLRHDLTEVESAGRRAAELVRQLLAFSRPHAVRSVAVDINEVVAGMESLLSRILGEHLELVVDLEPGCHPVRLGDRTQLEQIVLNLAINARDAMPAGGRLTIAIRSDVEPDPEPALILTVADTGVGMTPDVVQRCFEPFFTTKEPGDGTGLGLSTVYGIVAQNGGDVRVESTPGQGTTFSVRLPVLETSVDDVDADDQSTSRLGSETVLLVEDEDPVRELAATTLRRRGYTVLTAQNGEEAVGMAKEHPGPIDLLVTDVVMPGLGGPELAAQLAEQRPDLVVLYVSGYAPDRTLTERVPGRGVDFLAKPFSAGQLASAARRVLDHWRPRAELPS